MELTQQLVKELFEYKEGILYWKINRSNNALKGNVAGHLKILKGGNRWGLKINYKAYLRSRIIFLLHKGYLPKFVDHKDRNPLNDKIENLRDANRTQNNTNKRVSKSSVSKYLGVSRHYKDKWRARISTPQGKIFLGTFKTKEQAAVAYNEAALIYHKEFACLNIINN